MYLTSFWSWSTMGTPLISRISSPGLRGLPTRLRGSLQCTQYTQNFYYTFLLCPSLLPIRVQYCYHAHPTLSLQSNCHAPAHLLCSTRCATGLTHTILTYKERHENTVCFRSLCLSPLQTSVTTKVHIRTNRLVTWGYTDASAYIEYISNHQQTARWSNTPLNLRALPRTLFTVSSLMQVNPHTHTPVHTHCFLLYDIPKQVVQTEYGGEPGNKATLVSRAHGFT